MNCNRICIILLMVMANATAQADRLRQLQEKIPVECVSGLTLERLAGKYSNPPREIGAGLSGDDLYLFPDGTYVYDEWADIEPTTIRDKGKWKTAKGFVQLSSDTDVTWSAGAERKYMAVRRRSRTDEILLIGTEGAMARFDEDAKDEPEIELLVICKERLRTISSGETARLKRRLIRQSWRPEYFRSHP
jgi:hypothetical protein